MILRPPRSTRTDNSFPTRLSSDLLRFVYIDPKPDYRSISFGRHGEPVEGEEKRLPGFLTTILGALSEIPREQPIRDNVEAIEAMSRSEEHTSELQSLMRISYAVFCLKTKKRTLQQATYQIRI